MLSTAICDFRTGQVGMKRGDFSSAVCLILVPSFLKHLCNMYISLLKHFRSVIIQWNFNNRLKLLPSLQLRCIYIYINIYIQNKHPFYHKNGSNYCLWFRNLFSDILKTESNVYIAIFLLENPETFIWEICLLISYQSKD